jgi:hypothetical protein
MPLPTTGPWQMYAGATQGALTFNGTTGIVSGSIGKLSSLAGFFDETAQTLTFMVYGPLVTPGGLSAVEGPFPVYQAQLFQAGGNYILSGLYWMCGSGLSVNYATWYAQPSEPVSIPTPTPIRKG